MRLYFLICFQMIALVTLNAQGIIGHLKQLADQEVKLNGFNGLQSYLIAVTAIDASGKFRFSYTKADYGVGYLMAADNKPFFVILSGEDIEIKGEALSIVESISIKKGQENIWLSQYASEHPRREQALSAWKYLEKMYTYDSLFSIQSIPQIAIHQEINRIKNEDAQFLASLPEDSYVHWFLPTRKLVSSVSVVAQYRPEEIPETIAAFRRLDYTDPRLYKSGLFKDAIESHFWLLENSGRSLDSVFIEMQLSIDAMFTFLVRDEKKLNEVTDYLFDLLERHSLFQASEYLALKVLNEVSCTIDSDLAKQLETYRTMKKGNKAPNIDLVGDTRVMGVSQKLLASKLSDIKSDYVVVVFGASWCPKCTEELPKIAANYAKWRQQGVEVVFISLDDDKDAYEQFVADFPFLSVCDYEKWESPIADAFYVFATPTMFLLDKEHTILLRPNSVQQMDAWVDWYLIK